MLIIWIDNRVNSSANHSLCAVNKSHILKQYTMDLTLKKYIFANPVIVKTLQSWTLEGLKRTEGAKIALTNKFHLITQCCFVPYYH